MQGLQSGSMGRKGPNGTFHDLAKALSLGLGCCKNLRSAEAEANQECVKSAQLAACRKVQNST